MAMTDTTAFLAGCAISGVAAVLLLRGGFSFESPARSVQAPSLPTPIMAMPSPSPSIQSSDQDSYREWQLERDLVQQQNATQSLMNELQNQKGQTDDLKRETENLRDLLERQRDEADDLVVQLQEQQRMIENLKVGMAASPSPSTRLSLDDERLVERSPSPDTSRSQTIMIIAVGATVIVLLLGGAALFLIIIIFALQSQRRPPRTVHVIHPFPSPYPMPTQQHLLPAQVNRPKRAKQIDYDYEFHED